MIRKLLLLYALPLACLAQYVTTDDGSKLFFTSTERIAGTNQSFRSKLFSWDAEHAIQLVYESPTEYICCITIMGDGSLAAFSASTEDSPQTKGALIDLATGQVEVVGKSAVISRNGRFLFNGDSLIDRTAGTSRQILAAAIVGNDGSVLYKDRDSLHRVEPDGTDRIVMTGLRFGMVYTADENATMASVVRGPGAPIIVNTITEEQLNVDPLGAIAVAPYISADGSQMAFAAHSPPRVMLCRIDGTHCTFLATPPVGGIPVAVSGDAGNVYAQTTDNRIVRINTRTGRTEQAFVIASFSPLQDIPLVPGSLVRFYAVNAGNHITVNGREVPLLSSPVGLPVVQIPWDLPDQWVKFTMYGGNSPFETFTRTYPVSDFYPEGFVPGSPGVNEGQPAYRQDWSATTYQSPAVSDEIVHIYAVGLGATDCAIETGKPAPVDRLCRITRYPEWNWTTAPNVSVPAEVVFAGLAPGTIGLYQIDVRVPPFNGYEFIELSVGKQNPRVAFVRIRQP
ncbi:MAG: hypothetical protein M3Z32_08040 [Acidobacteriota bacterium]|nr:hypothetical protein [Acidobacteriota bacterium]